MRQIELRQLPNQSISITLNNNVYDLTIRSVNTGEAQIVAVDVQINGVYVVRGVRAVAGFPLIPSIYLENGNFMIVTAAGDLPNYTQFQISQFLVYVSQSEIDTFDASS